MKNMHNKIRISIEGHRNVEAMSPYIISASRATDIPAFYSEWLFKRLSEGYCTWTNPYNRQITYISFLKTKFIVFWSKNPAPLIPFLSILKKYGIDCYIQYTLNDYEDFELEPGLPPLANRIDTFKRLVDILGYGSVIWRFDPLMLTKDINIDRLLANFENIAGQLNGYVGKMVFSFADIENYKKVKYNLLKDKIQYVDWTDDYMIQFAKNLFEINKKEWNLNLATCAEHIDLSMFGIEHNKCIDPELIIKMSKSNDFDFQMFLHGATKDSGQRKACGCILSKDIGVYDTCPHGCKYCYANNSREVAIANYRTHLTDKTKTSII